MLYCKGCECIIVPGRAFLTSGGYYCPHCIDRMHPALGNETQWKGDDLCGFKGESEILMRF